MSGNDRLIKEALADTAALNGTVETLTAYQAQVFLQLTGEAFDFSDVQALQMIADYANLLSNCEERTFTPLAAARSLIGAYASEQSGEQTLIDQVTRLVQERHPLAIMDALAIAYDQKGDETSKFLAGSFRDLKRRYDLP